MLSGVDPLMFVGAVLLGLLAGLTWLTRRFPGGALGSGASRLERVALTKDHTVSLVEIGGVRLVIGTGPGGAPQVLAQLGEVEAEVASPAASAPILSRPWGELLGRLGVVGGR